MSIKSETTIRIIKIARLCLGGAIIGAAITSIVGQFVGVQPELMTQSIGASIGGVVTAVVLKFVK